LILAQILTVVAVSSFFFLLATDIGPRHLPLEILFPLSGWLWFLSTLLGFYISGAALCGWRKSRKSGLASNDAIGLRSLAWTAAAISVLQVAVGAFVSYAFLTSGEAPLGPRDSTIDEFITIAASAHQYRHLPSSMGGGNGSYRGFRMPKVRLDTSEGYSFRFIKVATDSIIIEGRYDRKEHGAVIAVIDSSGKCSSWYYMGDWQ